MEKVDLAAKIRESKGKGAAHKSRAEAFVPAVLYGKKREPEMLTLVAKDIQKIMHSKAGMNMLLNVKLEGKNEEMAMLKEVQVHPVSGNLIHVDLYSVNMNEPIDVKVSGEERRERGQERGRARAHARFFSLAPLALSPPKNHPSSRCRPLLHDPVRPHLRLRPHLRQGPRPQCRPRRLRGVHRRDGRPRVWAPRPPPHPRRRARAQDCGSQGQGLEPVDVVHWPARLCGG